MAKKSKKQPKEAQPEVTLDSSEEIQPAPVTESSPAAEHVIEREWSIQDAARQMVKGYKEMWWPSIRTMAHSEGLGVTATESQCKALFIKWGAQLK